MSKKNTMWLQLEGKEIPTNPQQAGVLPPTKPAAPVHPSQGDTFKMAFEFSKAPSSCVSKQHLNVCSGAAGAGEREFAPCNVQI